MAYSEEREGLFGDKYTAHYDDAGKKTGESRKRERLFGGDYIETRDAGGEKGSESTEREGLFGDAYVETRDTSGRVTSTAREKESLFGEKYLETRDEAGEKIAESRRRPGLFGREYVETTHYGRGASRDGAVPYPERAEQSSSSSSDSSYAWISLVFGIFVFVLAVGFIFINLAGWIASVALSVTIAYFYALRRWHEVKKQPEAGALIEQKQRKRGGVRYEVSAAFAKSQIRWFPDRLLLIVPSLLLGLAYAYLFTRSSSDLLFAVFVWLGSVAGAVGADFVGRAILRRRLNELVLKEERLPAKHYAWPTLTALIVSVPALFLAVTGVLSSLSTPKPAVAARGPAATPAPQVTSTSTSPSPSTSTSTSAWQAAPSPFAAVRSTPAAISTPAPQQVSEAELASRVSQFIDEHWTRYNGSAFSRVRLTSDNDLLYFEARDVSYQLRPQPIPDADRRNGKEWEGEFVFSGSATRSYSRNGTTVHWEQHPRGWTDWMSTPFMDLGVRATKRNGVWQYTWPTFSAGEAQKALTKPSAPEIRAMLEEQTTVAARENSLAAGNVTATTSTNATPSATPARAEPATPAAATPTFKGEVFAQTRTRYLTAADVQSWSAAEAQFAINELFARHGGAFGNPEITRWFSQFDWYRPRPGVDFDVIEAEMTHLERENIRFLGAVRDARRNVRATAQPAARRSPPPQERQPAKQRKTQPNPVAERFLEAILRGIADGLERR